MTCNCSQKSSCSKELAHENAMVFTRLPVENMGNYGKDFNLDFPSTPKPLTLQKYFPKITPRTLILSATMQAQFPCHFAYCFEFDSPSWGNIPIDPVYIYSQNIPYASFPVSLYNPYLARSNPCGTLSIPICLQKVLITPRMLPYIIH